MIEDVISISLPVAEKLKIRKNRYQNGESIKRISIVTGTHGDELEGQYVCHLLGEAIRKHPECLNGIVDIYPATNPLGIDSITRGIPAFDLDMNRIFPGNENGSMTEYVAAKLVSDLSGSDLVLDIHASNIFLTEIPQVRINELHADKLIPIAKELNIDLIWIHGSATVLESTLAYSLNSTGTDTLVVEMGVGMRITKEYCEQLTAGILNVMRSMGMWLGETERPRIPLLSDSVSDVTFLNAPIPGIFIKTVPHGTFLQEGDEIGKIVNPLTGEGTMQIFAPHPGILFTIREYPVVDEGSLMGRILNCSSPAEKKYHV